LLLSFLPAIPHLLWESYRVLGNAKRSHRSIRHELVTQEGNINIGANRTGIVVNPVSVAGRKKNLTNS
jgi:hypothetical protein